MTTEDLVRLAETYSRHRGLTLSTVSTYAANDGKWFGTLKAGRAGCTIRKANRVLRWLSEHWPQDLPWPADIDRPAPLTSTRKRKRAI